MSSALDRVLSRLKRVRRVGPGRYVACCAAHDDRTPSLSIRQADDGRVLLHCWSGCKTADVLAALGLGWGDLYPDHLHHRHHHQLPHDPEAERQARIRRGLRLWCDTTGRRLRAEFQERETIRTYAGELLAGDLESDLGLWLYSFAVYSGRPLAELGEALDAIDGARTDEDRAEAYRLHRHHEDHHHAAA